MHILKLMYTVLFLSLISYNANAIIYVDANASGTNDGTSWTNAYTEFQDVLLDQSNAGSEVWVAAGTYLPDWDGTTHTMNPSEQFLFSFDLQVYGGFNGTETSRDQRDWITNKTILSGDLAGDDTIAFPVFNNISDNSDVLIQVASSVSNDAVLDGFCVSGGSGDEFTPGAMQILGDQLFRNCMFYHNYGESSVANNAFNRLTMINCLIYENYSTFNGTIFTHDVGTTMINCTMTNNVGDMSAGFANGAYLEGSEIINCIFWGNVTTDSLTTLTIEEQNCASLSTDVNAFAVFENNIIEGFTGSLHQMTSATNSGYDPLFEDPSTLNFELLSGSPAIDAGDNSYVIGTLDLNLSDRIENGIVDLGCYEREASTAAIDEHDLVHLNIYPNPATNWVTVETENDQISEIKLLDAAGRLIEDYQTNGTKQSVELTHLNLGIYFLEVRLKSNPNTLKKRIMLTR